MHSMPCYAARVPKAKYRKLTRADMRAAADIINGSYPIEEKAVLDVHMKRTRLADLRGVEVDGELVAVARLLELDVSLGGRMIACSGLASLATLVEHRRRGHIGALIRGALAELRERGVPTSCLYPFDFGFYARFGWALSDEKRSIEVAPGALVRDRGPGRVVPSDMTPALRKLHSAWITDYNLGVVRSAWWIEHYTVGAYRTFAPKRRIYRYESPRGKVEGYVMYIYLDGYGGKTIVLDFVASTVRARRALLGLLGDLDSQTDKVKLMVAPGDPLLAELVHPDGAVVKSKPSSMFRIVDVKSALTGALVGDALGAESVLFEVDDRDAAWNRGVWKLAARKGKSVVTRARGAKPDVALSVQRLAQLVCGYLPVAPAVAAGLIEGPRAERAAALEHLAAGRLPYHQESY